ncbi:MAG: GNAT family N-acetyltransferase [Oscillospiraceae bacterium]|jgi:GNAT superfamily N-acetyltransferase|nr:GNAT family N-acetyltransferase [Oscillospiraceae bacterium]
MFRTATAADLDEVAALYAAALGAQCAHPLPTAADLPPGFAPGAETRLRIAALGPRNWSGWREGVYPTRPDAQAGLDAGRLYVLQAPDGAIVTSAILNHDQPPQYANARWRIPACGAQVAVVHTLVSHPAHRQHGYAGALLSALRALAADWGCRAVRLDTYRYNLPARALYEKLGYRRAGLIDLGRGAYGLHRYQCYERACGWLAAIPGDGLTKA